MDSAALSLLGLARKAGRIQVGEEPVGAACRARKARLVLLASDAADNTARRAAHFAQAGGVETVSVPFTKEQLGRAVGRNSCAMAALTDAGMAAGFLRKLAQADPARYGEQAAALDAKARKLLRRRRGTRRDGSGRTDGSQRPRAPPPQGRYISRSE